MLMVVTATNPAGMRDRHSDQTAVRAAPVNTGLPTISGNAFVGQTLTATDGAWSGAPTSFTYQWQRCDTAARTAPDISGATGPPRAPAADAGTTLRIVVTATNNGRQRQRHLQTDGRRHRRARQHRPARRSAAARRRPDADRHERHLDGVPTSFTYQWRRCDTTGANCADIACATASTYTAHAGDGGKTLRVAVTATNSGRQLHRHLRADRRRQRRTREHGAAGDHRDDRAGPDADRDNGTWGGSPTELHLPVAALRHRRGELRRHHRRDRGHVHAGRRRRRQDDPGRRDRHQRGRVTPATSNQTAVVTGAPTNTTPPSISGTTTQGQTLTARTAPGRAARPFAYQWQRCDSGGANCSASAARPRPRTSSSPPTSAKTIRVVVTATNGAGSTPATSAQTAVVQANVSGTTIGRTTIGASVAGAGSGFMAVSGPYTLAGAAATRQAHRLPRAAGASPQPIRALIYADNGSGAPGAFVGVSQQVTVAANAAAGWVDFSFSSSVSLPAGTYWLGYWFGGSGVKVYYDDVSGAGRYASASYSSSANPPANFGGGTATSLAFSLYASLAAAPTPPANSVLPAITGTATQGQTLSSTNGTWTGSPTSLRVSVAALRQRGRELCGDQRRDREHVHARRCRRRRRRSGWW